MDEVEQRQHINKELTKSSLKKKSGTNSVAEESVDKVKSILGHKPIRNGRTLGMETLSNQLDQLKQVLASKGYLLSTIRRNIGGKCLTIKNEKEEVDFNVVVGRTGCCRVLSSVVSNNRVRWREEV